MDNDRQAERTAQLRDAIIKHLRRHPLAGDTQEGIVACWLPSSGSEDAIEIIGTVVEAMVAAGELSRRNLPGGRVLFVRGPSLDPDP